MLASVDLAFSVAPYPFSHESGDGFITNGIKYRITFM